MSNAPRKIIRNAAAAVLAAQVGELLSGDFTVETSPILDQPRGRTPSLLVYTDEESYVGELGPRTLKSVGLTVEIRGRGANSGLVDFLDDAAWTVENLLLPPSCKELGLPPEGPVYIHAVEWTSTGPAKNAIGELVHGVAVVNFRIEYTADTPLEAGEWSDLLTVKTELDLAPPDGEAEVDIHVKPRG